MIAHVRQIAGRTWRRAGRRGRVAPSGQLSGIRKVGWSSQLLLSMNSIRFPFGMVPRFRQIPGPGLLRLAEDRSSQQIAFLSFSSTGRDWRCCFPETLP